MALSGQNTFNKLPAIFLDRDGTLNEEIGYLHKREDWRWLPGVCAGLARLSSAGFKLVVISNQAGMARGYYGEREWHNLCEMINRELEAWKARIDGFYFCPHHPAFSGECQCRKPLPGLLLKAAGELNIDLGSSWMIGDKASDVLAGCAAGCSPILVETGYGASEKEKLPAGIPVCVDFSHAVRFILENEEKQHVCPY